MRYLISMKCNHCNEETEGEIRDIYLDNLRCKSCDEKYEVKILKEIIVDYNDFIEAEKILDISRVITKKDRYEVLKRQRWACNICHCKLKYNKNSDWDGEIAHIDHIHPYSKRYSYSKGFQFINELENLQALCPQCNLSKSKKEIN